MATGRGKMTGSAVLRNAGVPRGNVKNSSKRNAYGKMKAIERMSEVINNAPQPKQKVRPRNPRNQIRNVKDFGFFA